MFPEINQTFFHNSFYATGKNLLHGYSCVSHGIQAFQGKPFVPDMKPCFMEAPFLVNVRKLFCNLNVEKEGVNSNYEQSLNIKKCKKI